jgi:hypothetical protein
MKIILNVFSLVGMFAILVGLLCCYTIQLPLWYYIINTINIVLLTYYPMRLCALDIVRDYRIYRRSRPVKILHYIKIEGK